MMFIKFTLIYLYRWLLWWILFITFKFWFFVKIYQHKISLISNFIQRRNSRKNITAWVMSLNFENMSIICFTFLKGHASRAEGAGAILCCQGSQERRSVRGRWRRVYNDRETSPCPGLSAPLFNSSTQYFHHTSK